MAAVPSGSWFARPEWERRFLLDRFPADAAVTCVRQITDRYLIGTRLRLRRMTGPDGAVAFKLTQKQNHGACGPFQGQLTTLYLAEEEFNLLAILPANVLQKTRHSIPPFGIDVFKGDLAGLILAEAEFKSAEEAAALKVPEFLFREVTSDARFTGGSLSATTRQRLVVDLRDFGITLDPQ